MTEEAREVKLVIDGQIARMYLSNPRRKNAISLSMWEDIIRHCAQLKTQDIRVLAISGVEGNFATGADLSEKAKLNNDEDKANQNKLIYDGIASLEELSFPIVAVLGGYVYGVGVVLAAVCDLRIAADNTKYCIPASKIGLGVERATVEKLVYLMGQARTMEMLLTGDPFSAEKALAWGLVNEVVPTADLENRAATLLNALAKRAPLSLKAAKQNIRGVWDAGSQEKEDPALQCFVSEDLQEGMKAFSEKREPNFAGR